MPFNRPAAKQRARALMRNTIPPAILVTLVFYLLTSTLFNVVEVFSPNVLDQILILYLSGRPDQIYQLLHAGTGIGVFLSILMLLYNIVMSFGYYVWSLRSLRQQSAGYSALLDGFGMVNRILLLHLQIFLRQSGWIFLSMIVLMVPMTVIIVLLSSIDLLPLAYAFLVIAIVACMMFLYARYAMAQYILIDQPDLPIGLVIHQSVTLIKGRIWTFFQIHLSFLGWTLLFGLFINLAGLAVFLMQLGYIPDATTLYEQFTALTPRSLPFWVMHVISLPLISWLSAYENLTMAGFYDHITGGQPADLLHPGQDAGF